MENKEVGDAIIEYKAEDPKLDLAISYAIMVSMKKNLP